MKGRGKVEEWKGESIPSFYRIGNTDTVKKK